jgi:hypothetical protein
VIKQQLMQTTIRDFADDVKCSHGCTIGQLDETAMFYMQQRGILKRSQSITNVRSRMP